MRVVLKVVATALAAGVTAATLAGAGPASAASDSAAGLVPNASFEDGWTASKLTCWNVAPADSAKLTVTKNAHTGSWAGYAKGNGTADARVDLSTDRTDACAIPVASGTSYNLAFWMRSTTGAQPVVFAYSATAGWTRWFTGSTITSTTDLRGYTVNLPAIPAQVTKVSLGLTFPGTGTVALDDVGLTPRDSTLFRAAFPANGLVTNEFAYWNPQSPERVQSPDWEMTSGSLFARNGNGYTGTIDGVSPDSKSTSGTDSAVFRLNTRDYSFGDAMVSMNLNIAKLTTTSRTPAVDWDGMHIFLHYQSQYELYYASVARRDGHVVIKKKCKGGPSNGGSYYPLGASEVSGMPFALGKWQSVGASVRSNADGTVTIVLYRDGKAVSSATDTGVGCAPITAAGATGIRGDNAEFDFNNFTVTDLS